MTPDKKGDDGWQCYILSHDDQDRSLELCYLRALQTRVNVTLYDSGLNVISSFVGFADGSMNDVDYSDGIHEVAFKALTTFLSNAEGRIGGYFEVFDGDFVGCKNARLSGSKRANTVDFNVDVFDENQDALLEFEGSSGWEEVNALHDMGITQTKVSARRESMKYFDVSMEGVYVRLLDLFDFHFGLDKFSLTVADHLLVGEASVAVNGEKNNASAMIEIKDDDSNELFLAEALTGWEDMNALWDMGLTDSHVFARLDGEDLARAKVDSVYVRMSDIEDMKSGVERLSVMFDGTDYVVDTSLEVRAHVKDTSAALQIEVLDKNSDELFLAEALTGWEDMNALWDMGLTDSHVFARLDGEDLARAKVDSVYVRMSDIEDMKSGVERLSVMFDGTDYVVDTSIVFFGSIKRQEIIARLEGYDQNGIEIMFIEGATAWEGVRSWLDMGIDRTHLVARLDGSELGQVQFKEAHVRCFDHSECSLGVEALDASLDEESFIKATVLLSHRSSEFVIIADVEMYNEDAVFVKVIGEYDSYKQWGVDLERAIVKLNGEERMNMTMSGLMRPLQDTMNDEHMAMDMTLYLAVDDDVIDVKAMHVDIVSDDAMKYMNIESSMAGVMNRDEIFHGDLFVTKQSSEWTISTQNFELKDMTALPSFEPSASPTVLPTSLPTQGPTVAPTKNPTNTPSMMPTKTPTASPSRFPTATPTASPSFQPSTSPTFSPTPSPTQVPTVAPTKNPSASPTRVPTLTPTKSPTFSPTRAGETVRPTRMPTASPTRRPTARPTQSPTTSEPSLSPSLALQTEVKIAGSVTLAGLNESDFDSDYVEALEESIAESISDDPSSVEVNVTGFTKVNETQQVRRRLSEELAVDFTAKLIAEEVGISVSTVDAVFDTVLSKIEAAVSVGNIARDITTKVSQTKGVAVNPVVINKLKGDRTATVVTQLRTPGPSSSPTHSPTLSPTMPFVVNQNDDSALGMDSMAAVAIFVVAALVLLGLCTIAILKSSSGQNKMVLTYEAATTNGLEKAEDMDDVVGAEMVLGHDGYDSCLQVEDGSGGGNHLQIEYRQSDMEIVKTIGEVNDGVQI
jgi:hypothetical protein